MYPNAEMEESISETVERVKVIPSKMYLSTMVSHWKAQSTVSEILWHPMDETYINPCPAE